MKIRARAALSAASILLVAAGAAGCGGGNDSASDSSSSDSSSGSGSSGGTSQSDFCGAFSTFEKNLASVDPTADPKTIVAKFKSEAGKLKSAGTPSSIPSDAKSGFTAVLDAIDKLPDDATLQDLSNLDNSLSDTDKKNGQAFETYLGKECPDLDTGSSASASSVPSASVPSASLPSASN